ncbi:MAG: hypothetical protein ACRDFR_04320 [Candidatus Limnocylindria bacterium]
MVTDLQGFGFPVLVTPGAEGVARTIASRTERALGWMTEVLAFAPIVRLEVLGPDDWADRADVPLYGMAHYGEGGAIWVPATYADLFAEIVGLTLEDVPPDEGHRFLNVYGDPPMTQPFVDLLSVHELAHLYHEQRGFDFGRRWLRELFCNIALQGYVVEVEPAARPVLETFPLAARHIRPERMAFTAIDDMDNAQGINYGWYQGQLHAAAIGIWDAGGRALLAQLYGQGRAAGQAGTPLPLDDLASPITAFLREWPG